MMTKKYHHPTDKAYKTMYKLLGVKLHEYFFEKCEHVEFQDTEIPESGKRRDITVKVDNKYISNIEFQSNSIYENKLLDIFEYHISLRCDKNNDYLPVKSCIICTDNPNKGIKNINIPYNINFQPNIIFTKEINGWELLNRLIYKMIVQEKLTDREAIDLLILPDTNIDLPIKTLMKIICFIMAHSNIPNNEFKNDIIKCEILILNRFFKNDELEGMINMLRGEMENPEIKRVIEKYGQGFDVIFFDGKEEGLKEGKQAGKIETAEQLLKEGIAENIIKKCTNITSQQLNEIKNNSKKFNQ